MSKRRANYRNTLAAAVLATVTVQSAFAQTTWLNAGTDFATVTNWNAGVPNATTLAVFPSIAAPVNPGVAFGTKTALGLSIDNTLGDYNVTSDTSSLETFSGGITLTGDGTTTIDAPLTLQANQAFTVPANGTLVANSGINVNGKQLTKLGLGTLILTGNGGSNLGPAAANRFIVNGGVVQLQSINPFGDPTPGSYNMLLKAGSTFEIKPATTDVAWGVSFDTTLGTLAGGFIEMENGTTLRALAGNTGAEAGEFGGGRSARIVNGSTVTLDAPDLDSIFVMASFMGNATETLAASGSKVNITGSGQMYLQGGTVGANAYTGAWDVQMSTADFGIVFTNSNASWGARTGGAPAQVTLTSGFAVDPNTSAANATSAGTSPITMNGGIYALSQAQALRTLPAQWNGSMTVNDVATGNFIRLAEVFSGVTGAKNMDVNQAGVFSGTGLLDIFGNTALGGPGTFFLKNTSTVTPNTFDGVLQVESGAAVDASTTATGSNPLGTGDVFLFGGGLTLNHRSSISQVS